MLALQTQLCAPASASTTLSKNTSVRKICVPQPMCASTSSHSSARVHATPFSGGAFHTQSALSASSSRWKSGFSCKGHTGNSDGELQEVEVQQLTWIKRSPSRMTSIIQQVSFERKGVLEACLRLGYEHALKSGGVLHMLARKL
eukprot:3153647-Pyramimonas_sp.AAC.1